MNKYRLLTIVGCAMLGCMVAASGARAQESERPWAKGVSQADQKKALDLFREGNKLLRESLFAKAVETYRQALKAWNHPAIHYNLVLALLPLDKPIEVYKSLERAMEFGEAPLDKDKFDRAKSYKILIGRQLAKIEITCSTPGTKVTLDGKPLFVAPGQWNGLVKVGEHSVTGEKQGYLTTNETFNATPGKDIKYKLVMRTIADVTGYRRKWAAWKPWAVVGGGAAFLVLGGAFHAMARGNFKSYDDAIIACGGCVPTSDIAGKKSSGDSQQRLAMASYVLGLAGLAAGATLVYINRALPYRTDLEGSGGKRLSVNPVITPAGAGLWARLRF